MQRHQTVAEAPSGQVPVVDSRFGTHDIRLSSALCALGFSLRLEAQPVVITLDANRERRTFTFYHNDTTKLGDFTARHVELWWNAPDEMFTIEGYDDALSAMWQVHASRWEMLELIKKPSKYKPTRSAVVATESIHSASILHACEMPIIGYDPSSRQWIFGKGSEVILALIKSGGKPKDKRPLSNDLCIDWMLESLRYHDLLKKLMRDPENIPVVEMRDGEKVLQISRDMNEKDARRMINRL